MDEDTFRQWADMDEAGDPGNPWGILADKCHRETNTPIERCIDVVVLHYLRSGQLGPLTSLFELGAAPGPSVLKCLAVMLEPVEGTEVQLPYSFELKRRDGKPGKYQDPFVDLRDRLIHMNAVKKGASKHGYRDRAVDEALALIDQEHRPGFETGLKAYKKYSGKQSRD